VALLLLLDGDCKAIGIPPSLRGETADRVSVARLYSRPRILLCMRHGLVKCRHPCPSIVGRGICNANLLDMTCWLLRQDHSDGTVRTRCDESPAHSRPRQWRQRWRRARTRLRPRRPTWFSRTSEDFPRLVLAPPGRNIDAIGGSQMYRRAEVVGRNCEKPHRLPVKRGSKSVVREGNHIT
jgi:hypothetical protein